MDLILLQGEEKTYNGFNCDFSQSNCVLCLPEGQKCPELTPEEIEAIETLNASLNTARFMSDRMKQEFINNKDFFYYSQHTKWKKVYLDLKEKFNIK